MITKIRIIVLLFVVALGCVSCDKKLLEETELVNANINGEKYHIVGKQYPSSPSEFFKYPGLIEYIFRIYKVGDPSESYLICCFLVCDKYEEFNKPKVWKIRPCRLSKDLPDIFTYSNEELLKTEIIQSQSDGLAFIDDNYIPLEGELTITRMSLTKMCAWGRFSLHSNNAKFNMEGNFKANL